MKFYFEFASFKRRELSTEVDDDDEYDDEHGRCLVWCDDDEYDNDEGDARARTTRDARVGEWEPTASAAAASSPSIGARALGREFYARERVYDDDDDDDGDYERWWVSSRRRGDRGGRDWEGECVAVAVVQGYGVF